MSQSVLAGLAGISRDDLKSVLGIFASLCDKNKEIVDDSVIAILKKVSAILSLKSSGKMTAENFAVELEALDLDKAVTVLNWIIEEEAVIREKDLDVSTATSLRKLQGRSMILGLIAEFVL